MDGRTDPGLPLARQRAMDQLAERFPSSDLTVDELERHMDLLARAESEAELAGILARVPGGRVIRRRGAWQIVPASQVPRRRLVWAIRSDARREGVWPVASRTFVLCFARGMTLDFREAVFGPGRTRVTVFCKFGSLEVIVPSDLPVEVHGLGLFGAFDRPEELARPVDRAGPSLRIDAVSTLGSVTVVVRDRD
jgi:hypothetical protein